MTPFKPVTFRTARGYEFPINCLHHVTKALAMAWPDKGRESYCRAALLAVQAAAGWCSHSAAYDAFVLAATEQKRIVEPRPMRRRVVQELAAIDPENFNPLPGRV